MYRHYCKLVLDSLFFIRAYINIIDLDIIIDMRVILKLGETLEFSTDIDDRYFATLRDLLLVFARHKIIENIPAESVINE